jgi:uncharacterized membrane protein
MSTGLFVLLIGLLLIAAVLVLFLPAKSSRSNANTTADRYYSGEIYRDDDRYWYGGFFYNNPDDPSMFVPKRFGLGWTVNFGNPRGRLFTLVVLLLPIVLLIITVLLTGTMPHGCHPSGCTP